MVWVTVSVETGLGLYYFFCLGGEIMAGITVIMVMVVILDHCILG
jgi:hypothetical protein